MVDQNTQFYAILTNVGAAKQANADALGIAWKITQMGVGDANGTDPTPNATQTSLINEWRRAPLNQLKVDDNDASIIVAEQVIPADIGGKWIREIGLYDEAGDLVAVANCAPTYKPVLSQGSGRTQVLRMSLVVSNAANVQLKIDPSVVLATREWVTEELARQDFKHSVQVATTANITLSGLQTIDGVSLTAGARVLVKNQTAAKDNGIYEVVAGAAWTRSADANSSAKVTPGLLVLVEKGTTNSDSAWQLVTDAPISLGVTALTFEMAFGRTGVTAGTYRSVQVDKYGRVVAATNPTTVAGYGLTDVYTKGETYSRTEITQAISTAVSTAVSGLVDAAPGALDTLKELATAIGNDPNFATTMVNELAKKAPLLSPKFTGAPETPTPAAGSAGLQIANMAALAAAVSSAARQFKSAVIGVNSNLTLKAEQAGNAVQFNTGPVTLTLPAVADVGNGASFMLRNPSATATQTLNVASAGSIVDGGSTITMVSLKPFEWMELAASGTAWFVVGRGKLKEVAELDSPVLTGTPMAPTAAPGTNTAQVATMAALLAGMQLFGLGSTVGSDVGNLDDLGNTGFYRAQGTATNNPFPNASLVVLHVQFNQSGAFQLVASVSNNLTNSRLFWRTKASGSWAEWQQGARLNSPDFSGTPTAPTASVGTNTIQLATTAFVQAAMAAYGIGTNSAATVTDFNAATSGGCYRAVAGASGAPESASAYFILVVPFNSGTTLQIAAKAGAGLASNLFWRTSSGTWSEWFEVGKLNSPAFTGTPTAPTAPVGTNTKQIATMEALLQGITAYGLGAIGFSYIADMDSVSLANGWYAVGNTTTGSKPANQIYGTLIVSGRNNIQTNTRVTQQFKFTEGLVARTFERTAYNNQWGGWREVAFTDSPVFTGNPTAPTPAVNDASKSLATAELVELSKRNFSGPVLGFTANMALTSAQSGRLYQSNAANLTVTLPAAGDAPSGTAFAFRHTGGGTLTLAPASGTIVSTVTAATLALQPGEFVEVVNNTNTSWFVASRGKLAEVPTVDAMNTAVANAAPPGMVGHFGLSTPPPGWLKRNGAAVSRTAYAALFAAIGTTFGAGDGSTTFNVPDDRELIDRAWTDGLNSADAGRALFSTQAGQLETHVHTGTTSANGAHVHTTTMLRERILADYTPTGGNAVFGDQQSDGNQSLTTSSAPNHTHGFTTDATGGNETRMANRAYLACIKY